MAGKNQKGKGRVKSTLARQDDGTVQLTLSIPYELVKDKREEALKHLIETLEVPGFRKGKAPKDVALKHIEQQQLYNHMLQHLLPEAYAQAVDEHNLQPILAPRFELVSMEEGEDWQVRATTCELPEVDLGDYKKVILGLARKQGIWVPGKDKDKKEPTREEKEQQVMKTLLEEVELTIPKLLVEEEVNHRLSQLLDQVQRLGITVEQYLSSTGRTIDQLKADYAMQAEQSIKLEILLNKIAEEEGIKIEDKEVEEVLKASGQKGEADPRQAQLIRSVLKRRKALDKLIRLI